MLGGEHSGKVSKKFIGNFFFWGITLRTCWQKFPKFLWRWSAPLYILYFDLFLLNCTSFVVRTNYKDPCKWCLLTLFIPQYIRTCLSKQNLFGSYMWVMGYFHKADYIFLLFTQLVNESCALHIAMVFMAWKLLWHTYKCSDHVVPWCGSKSRPQHQSPKAFLLFCESQQLLPVEQEQNIQCLPFPLLSERTPLCYWNSRM